MIFFQFADGILLIKTNPDDWWAPETCFISYLFHQLLLTFRHADANQVGLFKVSFSFISRVLGAHLGQDGSFVNAFHFDQVLYSHGEKCWTFQLKILMNWTTEEQQRGNSK